MATINNLLRIIPYGKAIKQAWNTMNPNNIIP